MAPNTHISRFAFGLVAILLCALHALCESPATQPAMREVRVDPADGAGQLQDAIDRMAAAGGGTVKIGPGRCVLRGPLFLRSHVRVIGVAGKTILASSEGATSRLAKDAGAGTREIVLDDATACRVGDGVAIRDERSPAAFSVTTATLTEEIGPKAFRLSVPLVHDYTVARKATVVRAFPVVAGWNIKDALVEGLTIEGNSEKAESIDGCRGAGIYLYACEGVTIRSCTVRNYRGDGISFQWASTNVTVEDCLVEKCLVFGLHPGSDSHHCIVRRNRSANNGGPGLFVCESVKHVLFEKNELLSNRGPGISIGCRDTDDLFRENRITGNSGAGVLFRDDGGEEKGAHRNVFERNTVLDNGAALGDGDRPASITILGVHHGLVFRENTLGYSDPKRGGVGILVIDGPRDFTSEANRFVNIEAEIHGPATTPSTQPK